MLDTKMTKIKTNLKNYLQIYDEKVLKTTSIDHKLYGNSSKNNKFCQDMSQISDHPEHTLYNKLSI
jgi:hypothetical protein